MTHNPVDLDLMARQLADIRRTTFCSSCRHPLDRHWSPEVTVEDKNGRRAYCFVSGCECVPDWAVPA